MKETIAIASASNEKYFPGLLATLSSILVNGNRNYSYNFYVIDGGLEENSKRFLETTVKSISDEVTIDFFIPDLSIFDHLPKLFFGSALPYARLLLPDLLIEEKVIYVDSDILFMKDISELWNLDLGSNIAAAALDTAIKTLDKEFPDFSKFDLNPQSPFFNSGVMVLDLVAFRKYQIHIRTLKLRSEYPDYFSFHDQSPLNVTLFEKFLLLNQEWNFQIRNVDVIEDYTRMLTVPLNYHFSTSFKPWLNYGNDIQHRLFYCLLEGIGFSLTSTEFVKSKRVYQK